MKRQRKLYAREFLAKISETKQNSDVEIDLEKAGLKVEELERTDFPLSVPLSLNDLSSSSTLRKRHCQSLSTPRENNVLRL